MGDVYSLLAAYERKAVAAATAVHGGLRPQVHGSAAGALECGCEAAAIPYIVKN
ncbi:MAG TPA: hypothetical protein VMX16_14390 [Terriglobia bacterium]|nr:hypothetical protein [Terriglobia bacterium]